jgi:hypothetical protein
VLAEVAPRSVWAATSLATLIACGTHRETGFLNDRGCVSRWRRKTYVRRVKWVRSCLTLAMWAKTIRMIVNRQYLCELEARAGR